MTEGVDGLEGGKDSPSCRAESGLRLSAGRISLGGGRQGEGGKGIIGGRATQESLSPSGLHNNPAKRGGKKYFFLPTRLQGHRKGEGGGRKKLGQKKFCSRRVYVRKRFLIIILTKKTRGGKDRATKVLTLRGGGGGKVFGKKKGFERGGLEKSPLQNTKIDI